MGDWAENARKRKQFRQAPAPVDVPQAPPARKDTKKWCGGKRGREHQPQCFQRSGYQNHCYDLCCTKCGKQLDYWVDWTDSSWGWRSFYKPPPLWVKL